VETSLVQTNLFNGKTRPGKFPSTEDPLGEAIPRCCLGDNDKSSILSGDVKSRQITNNPLKEKENISKTKFKETERMKNETWNKQSDGPLGTLSNNLDQSLDNMNPELIDNLEPSTAPNKKKKKCSKKPKSDAHCLKGRGSTVGVLAVYFTPLMWISVAMS